MRHMLFTSGPNKLSRGKLFRNHFDQRISVKHVEVISPLWPKEFDGLRIGHISDFHLGDLMPMDRALGVMNMPINSIGSMIGKR